MNSNPSDEDAAISDARQEVIDAFERSAEVYGLNRSYGRLYGILFFADEPLSLDTLVAESGYAKSTVSTAMKRMQRLHVVTRRSMPGEGKKAYYEAERDFWQIMQELLTHEAQREVTVMVRALSSAEARLEALDSSQAQADLEKIRSLKRLYERFGQLVDVLTSVPASRLGDLVDRIHPDR